MEWIVGTRPPLLLPYQSVESYSSPFECELALPTHLQQKCCVSLVWLGQKKPRSFFLVVLVSWNTCYLDLPFRMLPFGSCQTVSLGHMKRSHAGTQLTHPTGPGLQVLSTQVSDVWVKFCMCKEESKELFGDEYHSKSDALWQRHWCSSNSPCVLPNFLGTLQLIKA